MRIIAGLLTGHVTLNRHLTVMKIHADPVCPKCGEEETAYHLLGRCSAMMIARYAILGSHLMDIMELQPVQPHTLLRFAKASTGRNAFYCPSYYRLSICDLHHVSKQRARYEMLQVDIRSVDRYC